MCLFNVCYISLKLFQELYFPAMPSALFNLLFDCPFWVGYHTWPRMQSYVSVFCFVLFWLAQLGSIIVIPSVKGQLVTTDLAGDLGVRAPAAMHCVPLALTQEKVLLGLLVTMSMSMRLNCQWHKLCTCQQVRCAGLIISTFVHFNIFLCFFFCFSLSNIYIYVRKHSSSHLNLLSHCGLMSLGPKERE